MVVDLIHISFLIGLVCAVKGSREEYAARDDCDEKLSGAIGKFVNSTQGVQHNYLLWLMGLERDGVQGVEMLRKLENTLQLDITKPSQQRELAIILCHSPHLTFLSRMFSISFEQMEQFLHQYVKKVRIDGRLDILIQLGEISMELLSWAEETGYPDTPLDNTDSEEVLEFLQKVDERLGSDESVLRLWQKSNQHFPVGMPDDLNFKNMAFILSGEHTLGELASRLGLPLGELQVLSELNEQVLHNYITNISATMRLYMILNDYGIIDLDWE